MGRPDVDVNGRIGSDHLRGTLARVPRADVVRRHNVVEHGVVDARPLVFVHGFGCDQNMWRFVEPRFRDRYRTILLDHVGAGASDLSAYDVDRHASLAGCSLLGMLDEVDVKDTTTVLQPGEALVLFTDGVLEARAGADFFGEERMVSLVRSLALEGAQGLADGILGAAMSFPAGPPRDGIAVVVLKR